MLLAGIVVAACNIAVLRAASGRTYTQPSLVPPEPVALVFGAGLDPDQTPSAMLADRLDGAIALYRLRKVPRLLFSGDNGTVQHNELRAMLVYARDRGIPASAIELDYAGFTTRDSCYRARHLFGVRSAVLVTQRFHLSRALFLCAHEGIRAVGLAEPDWGKYSPELLLQEAVAREVLARTKAALGSLL